MGSIGVVEVSEDRDAEIGYWVTPAARGRGVATRAAQVVSAWLLRDIGMARLTWHAQVGNVASRRVAEAAGFVVEGTARRGMVHRGERVDAWVAAMLESDLERAGRADASPSRVPDWPYRPVELRTERLLLRAFRDEDAPSLLAYARDPMVVAWDQERTPDLEAAVTRARNRADWSSGELAAWAIADLEDRAVLGGIVLSDVDAVALSAEVGYGLMPEGRGHGYTAEALRRVTEWAFTETGVEPHRTAPCGRECRVVRRRPRCGLPDRGDDASVLPVRRRPAARRAPACAPPHRPTFVAEPLTRLTPELPPSAHRVVVTPRRVWTWWTVEFALVGSGETRRRLVSGRWQGVLHEGRRWQHHRAGHRGR